jgi:hypothetical protein
MLLNLSGMRNYLARKRRVTEVDLPLGIVYLGKYATSLINGCRHKGATYQNRSSTAPNMVEVSSPRVLPLCLAISLLALLLSPEWVFRPEVLGLVRFP